MRVACITYFVPETENRSGPSSLLYQLIQHRPPSVELTLFLPPQRLANWSKQAIASISEELGVSIQALRAQHQSRTEQLLKKWWPTGARDFGNPRISDLNQYDIVWGYPYWTAPFLRNVPTRQVISGMDSASLLYWRKALTRLTEKRISLSADVIPFLGNVAFEALYLRGLKVHTVGKLDAQWLRRVGAKPKFIRHPLLPYPNATDAISDRGNQLRILISNADANFYGSVRAKQWLLWAGELTIEQSINVQILLHKASPAFLDWARKEFEQHPRINLEAVGWIHDYSSFLRTIDVQLFPLDIGAGTKTSVLTALQHGVLCIGTRVALENIDSDPSAKHTVQDSTPNAFKEPLAAVIAQTITRQSANIARKSLTGDCHNPELTCAEFWDFMLSP